MTLDLRANGARLAVSDGSPVDGGDGHDLGTRAAETQFVGGVQLGSPNRTFAELEAEIFCRELDQTAAGDAIEIVFSGRRREQLSPLNHEEVFCAAFRHLATFGEQDGFVIAVVAGFASRERAVDLTAGRLETGRDGIVGSSPPGGDTNVQRFFVDVAC